MCHLCRPWYVKSAVPYHSLECAKLTEVLGEIQISYGLYRFMVPDYTNLANLMLHTYYVLQQEHTWKALAKVLQARVDQRPPTDDQTGAGSLQRSW